MRRSDDANPRAVFLVLFGLTGVLAPVSCCRDGVTAEVEERTIAWMKGYPGVAANQFSPPESLQTRTERWCERGRQIPCVRETLVKLLVDRDPRVELDDVASALGLLSVRSSVPALHDALQHGDVCLRREAALSLGSLRDPRSPQHLMRAIRSDPHYSVRVAALGALYAYGGDTAEEATTAALGDKDQSIARTARNMLRLLRGDRGVATQPASAG